MALGIGILLGVSMGDSTLVFNQLAVIEELEGKVRDYRQINEEISLLVDNLQHQLSEWDHLKSKYLQPLFKNSLLNSSVTLIAGEDYPVELIGLLEESGCSYYAYLLGDTNKWKDKSALELFSQECFGLEDTAVSSYGQILWEVVQDREENAKTEMLMWLQGRGLLEVKQHTPARSAIGSENVEVFLLTGDIPFVLSVLEEGIYLKDKSFVWIAVNAESMIPRFPGEKPKLPGFWHTIDYGGTYFSWIKIWELLYELQK